MNTSLLAMEVKKIFTRILLTTIFIFSFTIIERSPVPLSSGQMVLVITDSAKATEGRLFLFERNGTSGWEYLEKTAPVVIGRNGLGWGRGLHKETRIKDFPQKMEGDGRSPAGVFNLSMIFGFRPGNQVVDLKMPYLHLTQSIECVDDVNSGYYNRVVSRESCDSVDWQSSEKMSSINLYELGVVVDHNNTPIKNGCGSCIFLHLWNGPKSTTSGCTAMDSTAIHDVAYWLDKSKKPVLVQLTRELYNKFKRKWNLPKIPDQALQTSFRFE